MGKGVMIFLGILVVMGVFLFTIILTVLGWNNTAVQMEATVVAQYEQDKNNYTKMFNSIKEAAQVPDMYIAGLKEVWSTAIQGRYGKEGAKAVFTWIKEHNPQVDARLYTKLQSMIEANRNDFEANQKSLIDKKQIYEVYLKQQPRGVVLAFLGFPKIDLAKYSIVTSDETEHAFETKKAGPIKLKE